MAQPVVAVQTYNHLDPGHPDNHQTYRICGARTRNANAKYPHCHRPAGWRTSHAGAGRCTLHGGSSPMGPAHGSWTGGKRSYLYRARLAAQFQAVMDATQANPLDLTAELEAKRVIAQMAWDEIIATAKKVEIPPDRKGERGGVADNSTVNQITAAIPPSEPQHYFQIPAEKMSLYRDLNNDVVKTAISIIAAKNQTALARAEILVIQGVFKKAMERFVPIEQQAAFVKFLKDELRGLYPSKEGAEE